MFSVKKNLTLRSKDQLFASFMVPKLEENLLNRKIPS